MCLNIHYLFPQVCFAFIIILIIHFNNTMSLTFGSIIAFNYIIENKIGEGSFGVVYKATDMHTHKSVAIKIVCTYHRNPHTLNTHSLLTSTASIHTSKERVANSLRNTSNIWLLPRGRLQHACHGTAWAYPTKVNEGN